MCQMSKIDINTVNLLQTVTSGLWFTNVVLLHLNTVAFRQWFTVWVLLHWIQLLHVYGSVTNVVLLHWIQLPHVCGSLSGYATLQVIRSMLDRRAVMPLPDDGSCVLSDTESSQKTPVRFTSLLSVFRWLRLCLIIIICIEVILLLNVFPLLSGTC